MGKGFERNSMKLFHIFAWRERVRTMKVLNTAYIYWAPLYSVIVTPTRLVSGLDPNRFLRYILLPKFVIYWSVLRKILSPSSISWKLLVTYNFLVKYTTQGYNTHWEYVCLLFLTHIWQHNKHFRSRRPLVRAAKRHTHLTFLAVRITSLKLLEFPCQACWSKC